MKKFNTTNRRSYRNSTENILFNIKQTKNSHFDKICHELVRTRDLKKHYVNTW